MATSPVVTGPAVAVDIANEQQAFKATIASARAKDGGLVYQIRQLSQDERKVVKKALEIMQTPPTEVAIVHKSTLVNAILLLSTDKDLPAQYGKCESIRHAFANVFAGRISSGSLIRGMDAVEPAAAATAMPADYDITAKAGEVLTALQVQKDAIPAFKTTKTEAYQRINAEWQGIVRILSQEASKVTLEQRASIPSNLIGISMMLLDPTADWPDEFRDRLQEKINRLQELAFQALDDETGNASIWKQMRTISSQITADIAVAKKEAERQLGEAGESTSAQITYLTAALGESERCHRIPELKADIVRLQGELATDRKTQRGLMKAFLILSHFEKLPSNAAKHQYLIIIDTMIAQSRAKPDIGNADASLGTLQTAIQGFLPATGVAFDEAAQRMVADAITAFRTAYDEVNTRVRLNTDAFVRVKGDLVISKGIAPASPRRAVPMSRASSPTSPASTTGSLPAFAARNRATLEGIATSLAGAGTMDRANMAAFNLGTSSHTTLRGQVYGHFYHAVVAGSDYYRRLGTDQQGKAGEKAFFDVTQNDPAWNRARAAAIRSILPSMT